MQLFKPQYFVSIHIPPSHFFHNILEQVLIIVDDEDVGWAACEEVDRLEQSHCLEYLPFNVFTLKTKNLLPTV